MMRALVIRPLGVLLLGYLASSAAAAEKETTGKAEFFEKHIRPLLLAKCVSCHGAEKTKGGLRLDTKDGWQRGGDSGPVVVASYPDKSSLIQAVQHVGDLKMPPREKLKEAEIASLIQWIKEGAFDPRESGPTRIGGITVEEAKSWWAFQPVKRPAVPESKFANPIDAFITAKLFEKRLSLSPSADKRTLLRRVSYDLTGLPPTQEEIAAFEKDDSANAFDKVVDRLLASPRYGERWGRHWLDLVRYADTAGDNSDHPLPHAWRYRNWVIEAFNRDQPYDTFIREQIAGDLLSTQGSVEQYASKVVATGFLAIARRFEHDSDKAMHLTHEDGIDTIGKALLGLTLGCARCHDHKYDAITARDYYALYGILDSARFSFAGCEAKQQPRDLVPLLPAAEWDRVIKPYRDKLSKLDAEIQSLYDAQLKHARNVQVAFEKSRKRLSIVEIAEGGEKKLPEVEIDVKEGEVVFLSITPLKNHGADTTLLDLELSEMGGAQRKWNATADLVNDLLAGNPHKDQHGNPAVWWLLDARNQPLPLSEAVRDLNGKAGLHVWRNGETPSALVNSTQTEVTVWTKLPPRSLFLHPAPNGNVALAWLSPIKGKVKITGRIKDAHPGGPDGVGWVLEHFATDVRNDLLGLAKLAEQRPVLDRQKAELVRSAPKQEVAFAVSEGKPADTRIQIKGDPEKLGDPVPRRWLEVLGGQRISSATTSGRLDLAGWIASKENPLTARVMVNRLWLHHFGKGLVQTPNDFGTRGLQPTHPELLDWLATEFVDSGWSIKAMHRKILLSETYRQASMNRPEAREIDANNELLWKFDRRRLSAEELRDSLLSIGGNLNRTQADTHPFPPESSWNYSQHVPFSTFFETDRRSVYLINVRNRRHPFLGLFDGADPNATTPSRQATTVPTQALYFLNDPFFHTQAEKLVSRLNAQDESGRVTELFQLAFQREPTQRDREFALSLLERYQKSLSTHSSDQRRKAAWAALARILLASNEFLYVE
jgi:mono/diheme cytochrome c family protein